MKAIPSIQQVLNVAYFSYIQDPVLSGPSRFSEQLGLHSSSNIRYTCFTDSKAQTTFQSIIRIPFFPLLSKLPAYWLIRSYLFYTALKKYIKGYDLILCSNAFEAFFIVLLVKNKPIIIMINDDNYIFTKNHFLSVLKKNSLRKTWSRYIGYYIEGYVAKRTSKIIACSVFLEKQLAYAYNLPKDKITVIYPAVDLSFFKSHPRNYFSNALIHILFVKNDWRRGGLETVIEGLSLYQGDKKIQLNIAGVALTDQKAILRYVKKYKFIHTIHFCGLLNKNELRNEFSVADLLILPSRREAFGIAILEALATATPVIASDAGGIPEVLDYGTAGTMISCDSPRQLAASLNTLINQPEVTLSKMEHGRSYCEKFSTNILYSHLDHFCRKVAKEFSIQTV